MQTKPTSTPKRKRRSLIALSIVLAVIVLLAAAFFIYTSIYYHADSSVWEVAGTYAVTIEQKDGYIAISPETGTPDTGYVFYPGGKVEATAYLPYLASVAQEGYYCVLLEVPFRLAVFDMNAAAGPIADNPTISTWAVGGHALGGVAAADFAGKSTASVLGLVLLATYTTSDLTQNGLSVVSITTTNDEVLNWDKYEEAMLNLPDTTEYVSIEGGNHGQFGMYGVQNGDGFATISPQEQRDQAVAATVDLLSQI